MQSEDEMKYNCIKACALMHSLAFCAMGEAEMQITLDKFSVFAEKIMLFLKKVTSKDDGDIVDLAMELIQNEQRAVTFIRENVSALAS